MPQKIIFITAPSASNGTWTVPADWDSANNTIIAIGGGGGGSNGGWMSGGAGGGCSVIRNLALTPGASVAYRVGGFGLGGAASTFSANSGTSGGDTWFNGATLAAASVGAKGGGFGPNNNTTPAQGGQASAGVAVGANAAKYSGGNGGVSGGWDYGGAGGGGAAGPTANGSPGSNTTGTSTSATLNGFAGGASGGGAAGGAGATAPGSINGAKGGLAAKYTADQVWNGTAYVTPVRTGGPGGGGGGGGGSLDVSLVGTGGYGGYYGGGGGGGGFASNGFTYNAGRGGDGELGIIIVIYGLPTTDLTASSLTTSNAAMGAPTFQAFTPGILVADGLATLDVQMGTLPLYVAGLQNLVAPNPIVTSAPQVSAPVVSSGPKPAKRILLGAFPEGGGKYGLRIAQPGYNAEANPVEDEYLVFNSDWPAILPIHVQGQVSLAAGATMTVMFANLGYIPFAAALIKINAPINNQPRDWEQFAPSNCITAYNRPARVAGQGVNNFVVSQRLVYANAGSAYWNIRMNTLSDRVTFYSSVACTFNYFIYRLKAF